MSVWGARAIDYLLELGRTGCQGNLQDYQSWVRYAHDQEISTEELVHLLEQLTVAGQFMTHPDVPSEYLARERVPLGQRVEYTVSGDLSYSPIQMVRSRLEAFLRQHAVDEDQIVDLSIATTEAMENAVKYSDHKHIEVAYEIRDGVFYIRVVNRIGNVQPEQDIQSGKYSGSLTLMRGMMVMVKLFDEMDIDISEEQQLAIFTAQKKLHFAG